MRRAIAAGAAVLVATVGAAGAGPSPGLGPSPLRSDETILTGRLPVPLSIARASVAWCGSGPSPVDRTPEVEVSSPNEIHVVYAVPADGADRFADYASAIASDMAAVDAWWQRQDPSRTLRFDLFPFPGCASRFGMLDIGFARLPRPGAEYLGGDRMDKLVADLAAFDGSPATKNLVYYDGPVSEAPVCGSTNYLSPTSGAQFGVVFVWLQSQCPNDLGQGRLQARVAAHELIHNLGALIPQGQPHQCPDPANLGHVCDSSADILFPYVTADSTLDAAVLDAGRDDYYGHSGTWVDVQDSPWLIHLPQFPLTMSVAGSSGATGAVNVTAAATVPCPQTCSLSLDNGTAVVLTAQPGQGSRLLAWSGACSGTATCSLRMDGAKSVTATFGPSTFRLSVSVVGKGKVVSSPAGIACPSRCASGFSPDAPVFLRPRPARGYRFAGWSGLCRGTVACSVRVDRARSVRATFRAVPKKR